MRLIDQLREHLATARIGVFGAKVVADLLSQDAPGETVLRRMPSDLQNIHAAIERLADDLALLRAEAARVEPEETR